MTKPHHSVRRVLRRWNTERSKKMKQLDVEVAREALAEIMQKLDNATDEARTAADRVAYYGKRLSKISGDDDLKKAASLLDDANEKILVVESLQRQARSSIERVRRAQADYENSQWRCQPQPTPRGPLALHASSESADANKVLFESQIARRFSEK
jgi:chromosome segregation ATPase